MANNWVNKMYKILSLVNAKKFQNYLGPTIVVLFFAAIYSSISLVNHYNFRTHSLDLAINNQAIYDYSLFHWNTNTIMNKTNILSDHFSLLEIFVSPFRWIFGSYTLLLFQIFSILFGGIGIFKLVKMNSGNEWFSLIAMVFFFSIWGIFSALSFDYHDNVVAAMLVPWLIYHQQRKEYLPLYIYFGLILVSKENMALWAVFIGFGLFLCHNKDKQLRRSALFLSLIAAVYFILVMKYIMPFFFDKNMSYLHYDFNILGNNFEEALINIIQKPLYTISLLFKNHLNESVSKGIKWELHSMVLLSGGIFMLYKPQYLIMLLPIYGQKLFNNNFVIWGINLHYSIEFVPILTIAAFDAMNSIKLLKIKFIVAGITTIICIAATVIKLDHRVSKYYNPIESQFYAKQHWRTQYDVKKINRLLKTIPGDSKVCAQEMLCPHLAFRRYIYVLPYCKDPDCVIFFTGNDNFYPFKSRADYNSELKKYKESQEWSCFYADSDLVILNRKSRSGFQSLQ
jgi:uncharacterized membrane protein